MTITQINSVEEARQWAIDWQNWAAKRSLSYTELADWQRYLEVLGRQFNLTDEFKENGIL